MICELASPSFGCLPSIFRQSEHSLVIRSITAGHTPASAWVDDAAQPASALVWDHMGGLYLAGQPDRPGFTSAIKNLLIDQIIPSARDRWIPEMEVYYDRPSWEPVLKTLLPPDLQARPAAFNSYRLEQPQVTASVLAPPGFEITPVNRQLLAAHGVDHLEHLTGWILSFYHNLTSFLETGFGYVAIAEADRTIASLCIAVFVAPSLTTAGHDYELGLATAPEYRQRGLAQAVAAAAVRHCLANGDTPVWHCWADNEPSARIAEKVGFVLLRQTPAVRFATGCD